MERHADHINLPIPPTLKADFKLKARQFGFSMSEALKSMIRDFLYGKTTLTEYPDLNFKAKRDSTRLKQPRRKDRAYHDVWSQPELTKGTE